MDSEKLLGCPFCGAKAFARKHTPGFGFSWLIEVLHGDTCPIRTNDYVMCHKTLKSAVAEWNTRPTPENGLREALERIREGIVGAIKRDDGPNVLIWGGQRIEGPAADAVFAISEAIIEACDAALQHNTGERGLSSADDYAKALSRLEQLMDALPGTPEGDELKALATEIEAWEEVHGR